MAIVSFSPVTASGASTGLAYQLFGRVGFSYSGITGAGTAFFDALSSGTNGIAIMQGTPPSNFSTLTSYSARSADTLLFIPANNTNFGGASFTNNRYNLSTPNVLATQSGTATWFWALTADVPADTGPIYQQFIGTVGVSGSGADLTITDTAIVSGNPYRITSLIIEIPTTYTV